MPDAAWINAWIGTQCLLLVYIRCGLGSHIPHWLLGAGQSSTGCVDWDRVAVCCSTTGCSAVPVCASLPARSCRSELALTSTLSRGKRSSFSISLWTCTALATVQRSSSVLQHAHLCFVNNYVWTIRNCSVLYVSAVPCTALPRQYSKLLIPTE